MSASAVCFMGPQRPSCTIEKERSTHSATAALVNVGLIAVLGYGGHQVLEGALSLSTSAQQKIFDSADLHAGVAAFLEAHKQNEFKYRPAQDRTALQRFGELQQPLQRKLAGEGQEPAHRRRSSTRPAGCCWIRRLRKPGRSPAPPSSWCTPSKSRTRTATKP